MKRLLVSFVFIALVAPVAAAQQPATADRVAAEPAEPAVAAPRAEPAIAPDADEPAPERRMAPPTATLLQQCEDLLRSDAAWRTRLRDQLTARLLVSDEQAESELSKENLNWRARMKQELAVEIHQQDADLMATNRKHVIMAYAALWVLAVLFIVYMYRRQMRLREEIARLEREIRDAAKE